MTYTKPDNVSFTAMAIWIDSNVYTSTCDDIILYEYLYHLSNMLAHEGKYFTKTQYYDDFSLYCASKLFMRLKNPKQFLDEGDSSKLAPVKSVLNYLKKVIYPMKVDFEQEHYLQSTEETSVICASNFDLGSFLVDETDVLYKVEFSCVLNNISHIVKSYLQKIPYRRNSAEWTNIYVSCMLTILDSITLSNFDKKKISSITRNKEKILDRLYTDLRYREPLLFHLNDNMKDYIAVLVNELRHVISSQLSQDAHTRISAEDTAKNIIMSSIEEE